MKPNLLLPAATRDQIVAFLKSLVVPAPVGRDVMAVTDALSSLALEQPPEPGNGGQPENDV